MLHLRRLVLRMALLPSFAGLLSAAQPATDGNRLTYLDENDPFYVGADFPRLITPQWIGETGVEAVVVLAVDDMTATTKWETFLRPILEQLKQIDGRAPVSIMTVSIDPFAPQLGQWLKEGLSLEVHTLTHPCPCLAKGDFPAAADTYHRCVELMNRIPGNKPVAFRMPCCDSINSPSPRFYAEIFNRTNAAGQFLTIDSSVMNIFSTNDPSLPRDLVLDSNGARKFHKYLPFPSFATIIENYPYPYVIGKLCWEFPGMVPSDWEAQHFHGTNNPATVSDWKAALDATVIKQGAMSLIFHPHGWIKSEQIVELIDYAVQKYGRKVKFLTFREAQQRLDLNLLHGHPLRAANGQDNGVRLLDLNNDGFMDVIWADDQGSETRVWNPQTKTFNTSRFPTALVTTQPTGERSETGVRFGIIRPGGQVTALIHNDAVAKAWTFDGKGWMPDNDLLAGLEFDGKPILTAAGDDAHSMKDRGVRLRDIDGDGRCELIVANESQKAVFSWSDATRSWKRMPYSLPANTSLVNAQGRDNGLRFVDVNGDGFADILFSNEKFFSLHLFIPEPYLGFDAGWSREVLAGKRGEPGEIPMIARGGSNNGAWFHSQQLWVQNEDTSALPDHVDRRSFDSLLAGLQPPPLSPENSLKAIRVPSGFKVELVASEPLVQSPIAFEWGADGKLWVVEMGDYPLGVDGKGKPGGILRFLEDTNHDGIYDKSTVFLDGLNFPTGVIPWGRGVIVSAAPEIFYAEDTDGDGKADVRTTLFTGFHEGNQQHRLNGFDYGLDNWIYGANGDSGGVVRSVGKAPTERPSPNGREPSNTSTKSNPVNIRGRDFRFRPADGVFETQAGETQFGRHRDDWGNWFGNNNSAWLWHYFLPEQYIARNRHLPIPAMTRMLADYADATRVFPIARQMQRFNDIGAQGHVTSANSAMPYRDDLFGPGFANSVFISEPVYNLVHREVLEADGVSFTSHRAASETQSEFLASTDNWFRPTMTKTGPDGALYICDIYRLVIEHPQWIPDDVKQHLDLRAGHDKGRIYRVYPADVKLREIPRLDQLDSAGLVAALDSPNGWQRDTAQRLLVERGDKQAAKYLTPLVTGSERPKARLQALCALDGLGAATPALLENAFRDPDPAVREQAIRISEPFLRAVDSSLPRAGNGAPDLAALGPSLLNLVNDPAIRVRYQLSFTLGEWDDPRAGDALVKLASTASDNPEMQIAVLSSAVRHVGEMLASILRDAKDQEPPAKLLAKLLGLATASGDDRSLAHALEFVARPAGSRYAAWQLEALAGMLDALERANSSLLKLQAAATPELKTALQDLDGLFARARSLAAPESALHAAPSDLLPALRLLARGLSQREPDLDLLAQLLQPQFESTVQRVALAGLRRSSGKHVAEMLLAGWQSSSPALRPELIAALFTRGEWTESLLGALESGQIPLGQLSPSDRQKLLKHSSPAIRQRAIHLYSDANSDRQKVVESYHEVLNLSGDPAKGAVLFKQNCAVCHEAGERPRIGPDLGALADKSTETLLIAILDPNRAVEVRYVNYTALTRDGREFSGIMTAETPNSITLSSATGEETILRASLDRLASSGLSLMPEGFEKILQPQDLANVIAFLKSKAIQTN
jgi:putative membrane-bound dehydrogenase-like protein